MFGFRVYNVMCRVAESKQNMMTFNLNNNKQKNIQFTYVSNLSLKYVY
jgi:hypothetical protein